MVNWSMHLRLVEAVHHHGQKFLYDGKSKGWQNKCLILNEFCRLLNMDEALKSVYASPEHACEWFKRCRGEYRRRKRMKPQPITCSCADHNKLLPGHIAAWPLFEALTFLDAHIKDRDTEGHHGTGGGCTINCSEGRKVTAAEADRATLEQDAISAAASMEQSSDYANGAADPVVSRHENALVGGMEGRTDGNAGVPGQDQSVNPTPESSNCAAGPSTANSSKDKHLDRIVASSWSRIDRTSAPKPPKRSREQRGTSGDEMAADDGDQNVEKKKILPVSLRKYRSVNVVWAEHLAKQMDAAFSTVASSAFRAKIDARLAKKLKKIEQRRVKHLPQ